MSEPEIPYKELALLAPQEQALIHAMALTMKAACILATTRDQLVAEGGHTHESALYFLNMKYGAHDKPVADLIEWWDHECSYSTPAFSRILDSMEVTGSMRAYVLACGAHADSVMSKMLATVRKVH